jgi:hypothetical protein
VVESEAKVGKKRTRAKTSIPTNDQRPAKRVKHAQPNTYQLDDHSIAAFMVKNYESFNKDIQTKILNAIDAMLKQD